MSYNKVILVGNLGKDPKLFTITETKNACRFDVATNEPRPSKEGERENHTEWHSIVVYGNQADLCAKFLKKGSQVFVEGKLRTRKWDDEQGNTRYITEIVASRVEFLNRRNQSDSVSVDS